MTAAHREAAECTEENAEKREKRGCAAPWALTLLLAGIAGRLAAGATPSTGDQVCAECHREIASRFQNTPMAKALVPVASCEILQRNPKLTFREGGYETRIERQGDRSLLTVTGGGETLTVPLLWAFGRGQAGQTYVFEHDGIYYESRISFYIALGGPDLTLGAQGSTPANLNTAAGRPMDSLGARDCFGCHSTGAVTAGRLHLESIVPGVGCESCHGPAGKHVAAVRAGDPTAARMRKLASLTAEETSELCGSCHRTWSQIALKGPRGVNNVRFQPYRLANSKCYDTDESRIRCTACHDPHGPLQTNAASYDARCAACHSTAAHARTCTVAKKDCVTCHMPKIELPGAHTRFTDHQIRIVRAGRPYPNE